MFVEAPAYERFAVADLATCDARPTIQHLAAMTCIEMYISQKASIRTITSLVYCIIYAQREHRAYRIGTVYSHMTVHTASSCLRRASDIWNEGEDLPE